MSRHVVTESEACFDELLLRNDVKFVEPHGLEPSPIVLGRIPQTPIPANTPERFPTSQLVAVGSEEAPARWHNSSKRPASIASFGICST